MRLTVSILALSVASGAAFAQNDCAAGKTLTEGTLTVATGNPAYFPWVIDDAPESKQGFEAAVAYAVANAMGFSDDQVTWVRSSFDQAIQPGAKDFDINIQQYSITPERDEIVDFSAPYYSAAMAVLTRKPVVDAGLDTSFEALKGVKWGADAATTAVPMLAEIIQPDEAPLLYNDNADVVEAMKAGQIDAALFDLPTALYLGAVVLDDGVVLGQFPAERTEKPDQFGMLFEEGNPLKACVDAALEQLRADGTLAQLEATWLSETTGVPVIE
ncbi:amino acid ABC transporter substrate-binding protein [Silicimonas algicola]|uniref:Amino acid ABC transporter substrate-binding protein (PAAT family) n=1 Tax=Silicimonas algicola TaxID=1826607 RepID=A0A316GE79_9RHOB|nr:ABC transporter substrate-binding protein [Silicimonas algicola]AZQ66652.1 amino acid ABC transporter substrate-binding protein [Silicimonas algicola]PWK59002.1 amino acid ABC transporter substrate-binding protein (PAAT family) [Silicimonas algicola]